MLKCTVAVTFKCTVTVTLCKLMEGATGSLLRVPIPPDPERASAKWKLPHFQEYRDLDDFGISFGELIAMVTAGLVSTEQPLEANATETNDDIKFDFGSIAAVVHVSDKPFVASQYILTRAGLELSHLVDRESHLPYLRALKLGYDAIGFPTHFVSKGADDSDRDITDVVMQSP